MPNIAELEATMTYIVDHPDEHDQSSWICGTSACFAGHTALRHGWRPAFLSTDTSLVTRDGEEGTHSVRAVANKILGLSIEESQILFGGANDIEELQAMVKDMANGEDLTRRWRPTFCSGKNGPFKRVPDGEMV